jgi:hypothetical protein
MIKLRQLLLNNRSGGIAPIVKDAELLILLVGEPDPAEGGIPPMLRWC